MNFDKIENQDSRKILTIPCRVINVAKTSGPLVISLFDGKKHTSLKYKNINNISLKHSDLINAKLRIISKDKSEFIDYYQLSDEQADILKARIKSKLDEFSKPLNTEFMIESKVLEGLKPRMESAAKLIRESVMLGRQIIIRHHADCDGYSAAYILEQAIGSISDNKIKTLPSRAPFNDYRDISRDIVSNKGKDSLFISLDNGSTEQDLLAFKKLKAYGFSVIVVDHHLPSYDNEGTAIIDNYVDVHINSHLEGGGSQFSAGMLSAELSRLVGKVDDNLAKEICALSGVADRCEGKEFESYLDGHDKKHLMDLSECIDFEANYATNEFMHDIINNMREQLIKIILPEIKSRKKIQLDCALKYCSREERDNLLIIRFRVKKISLRGEFPKKGKITGMLKDYFETKGKPVLVIGISDNHISLRTNIDGFSINDLIKNLKTMMPFAMIDGGGHDVAGSIAFAGGASEEIISEIYKYATEISQKNS